jgi:vacuolar protein sorting-associated protein 35
LTRSSLSPKARCWTPLRSKLSPAPWFLRKLTPSPDLHTPQTTANLLALLVAPITSYLSVLTLLAIPSYTPLLSSQPYSTRMAIGQAVVSSVLKNNTLIETSEDVSGVLGLCAVLVRDQKDSISASGPRGRQAIDYREMAEEQGWVARMVHLFKSDDLAVQFEVSYRVLFIAWFSS